MCHASCWGFNILPLNDILLLTDVKAEVEIYHYGISDRVYPSNEDMSVSVV